MYNVKNCSSYFKNYPYSVIRNCNNEYWYYGCYNDIYKACNATHEIGNGIVVESNKINSIF